MASGPVVSSLAKLMVLTVLVAGQVNTIASATNEKLQVRTVKSLLWPRKGGAYTSCTTTGPPATVSWVLQDGTSAKTIPSYRHLLKDGSIVFGTRTHNVNESMHDLRCRAASIDGHLIVLSQLLRVEPVDDEDVVTKVRQLTSPISEDSVVLRCEVSRRVNSYVIINWFRNGKMIYFNNSSAKYRRAAGGMLLTKDFASEYSCSVSELQELRSGPLKVTNEVSSESIPHQRIQTINIEATTGQLLVLPCPFSNVQKSYTLEHITDHGRRTSTKIHQAYKLIRGAGSASAGLYECCCSEDIQSNSITVKIKSKLTVQVNPETLVTSSGQYEQFHCVHMAATATKPFPTQWFFNGNRLPAIGNILNIGPISKKSEGVYQCSIDRGGYDSAIGTAQLIVKDVAPNISCFLENGTVLEGRHLTMGCHYTGIPLPTVPWAHDDVKINFHENKITRENLTSDMTITAVPCSGGWYSCVVKNSKGSAEWIRYINVRDAPRLEVSSDQIVHEHGRAAILCSALKGKPPLKFSWIKNGEPVSRGIFESREISSTIELLDITVEDDGIYTCVCENDVGYASSSTKLTVLETPRLIYGDRNITTLAGGTTLLPCLFEGISHPTMSWYRGTSKHGPWSMVSATILSDGTLLLKNTSSYSSWYKCHVTNNEGTTLTSTAFVEFKESPRISYTNNSVMVAQNISGSLTCVANGEEDMQLQWIKSETILFNDGDFNITEERIGDTISGNLVLENVRKDLGGYYVCRVEDMYGSTQKEIQLIVIDGEVTTVRSTTTTEVTPTLDNATIAFGMLGAVVFVILVVFSWLCVWFKRRGLRNNQENPQFEEIDLQQRDPQPIGSLERAVCINGQSRSNSSTPWRSRSAEPCLEPLSYVLVLDRDSEDDEISNSSTQ